jgi:hypothetical protein
MLQNGILKVPSIFKIPGIREWWENSLFPSIERRIKHQDKKVVVEIGT